MYLEQLKVLQQWLDELATEIPEIFKSNEACQRLATVPGIGPVIATALVSSVGDPSQFRNGRQFAAWLGLTPMQRLLKQPFPVDMAQALRSVLFAKAIAAMLT
jgi:transposase